MTSLRKPLTLCGIAFIVCITSGKATFGQSQPLTAFYTAHVVSMAPM